MDNNQLVLYHLLNVADHIKNVYDIYYPGYQRPIFVCSCCLTIYHHFKHLLNQRKEIKTISPVIVNQPVDEEYEFI